MATSIKLRMAVRRSISALICKLTRYNVHHFCAFIARDATNYTYPR
ncbi:Uncharacterised protein [Vibrio cholerae]|nr:Uncharacterised protein [Vibrio cholerae]CSI91305.1 Uncharacterised protein [Vibrio cholerae]